MIATDAERVLRILSGAWGYFASDPERVVLWSEHLERLDFEPTRTAVKKLTETSDSLPSLAAFLRAARDEARFARLAASAPTLHPTEGTYSCSCGDTPGWVVVIAEDTPTVRPCDRCRPVTYEQWYEGHYGPKHDRKACAECRRTGRAA